MNKNNKNINALIASLFCGILILGFQNCTKSVKFENSSNLDSHSNIDPSAPPSSENGDSSDRVAPVNPSAPPSEVDNKSPLGLINSPSCRDKKYPVILTKNTDLIVSSYMDFIRTNDSNYLIQGDNLVINIDGLYSSCVEIVGSNNKLILSDKKYSSSLNKIKVKGDGNTLQVNSNNNVDIQGDRSSIKMISEYLYEGYTYPFNINNTISIVGNDATVENLNYTQNLNLTIRGDHFRIINHDKIMIANIDVVGNDGFIDLHRVPSDDIVHLSIINTQINGNRNSVIIEDAWTSLLKIQGDKNYINFNRTNFSDQTNILIGNVYNEAPTLIK